MSKSTHEKGDMGENIAARYLENHGYEILDRNWRIREGELDLVVRKGGTIVFVEVKTAYGKAAGSPREWVNKAKQSQIGKIANAWIAERRPEDCFFRFDVLALVKSGAGFKVAHIEDAFRL